ncbi:uncharacterized protein LOC108203454 [Daucus carota subsp. sativus]|uniref:uncharacterized protein LOC108203454 n=1 Tax=Daucus carota subsp. sativus TaxID=79200 RepID=UPI003083D59F
MKYPCKKCASRYWNSENGIHEHLICNGLCPQSIQWIYEVSTQKKNDIDDGMDIENGLGLGNEFEEMIKHVYENNIGTEHGGRKGMDDEAKKFYRLVEEGGQPLYPDCTTFTRLSFIVRLYQLKCVHGMTESAVSDLLKLIKDVFPNNIPSTFKGAKTMIKDLGLNYEKIHACKNDCMLFWAENEKLDVCKKCGASRWKEVEDKKNGVESNKVVKGHKIPLKVMRYFPLKKRLQRMFLSSEMSKLMTWHALARKKDGRILRHPADGQGWKSMDNKYPNFAGDFRNVRLGLAADGFNPYRTMSISHSTWPVVLVNYNLPPWLIMKPENLILSTIIPGPTQPGNDIDIYLQPLIAELKELWVDGIQTYDTRSDCTFKLQASLLWTISDFPGYGVLSGWSTKGHLACPSCHYDTSSTYLKHSKKVVYLNHRKFLSLDHKWRSDKRRFNGEVEMGERPELLTGMGIQNLVSRYENCFGKGNTNQKGCSSDCPWKKLSIFFELPYWSSHMVKHNLDVMHIEKNICDKILGTLLNIGGNTKDHLNGRLDLQEMGIRKILHPYRSDFNDTLEIRAACFDMTKQEKEIFCSVLKNAKFPHGSASHISRCVQERKVAGYKSHDAHYILQYLLEFAVVKTLKPEVAIPLRRLGAFFRRIYGKVIELDDVHKLQEEIIEILCQLEMIFPPSFFDIMVHLPIHLCTEIEFGGVSKGALEAIHYSFKPLCQLFIQ